MSITKTEIHVRAQENYERERHFRKWSSLTPAKWLPYLNTARQELIREARPRDTSADADIDARAQENYLALGAPRGPWGALHPEKQFPYRYIAWQELRAEASTETPLPRADLTEHAAQLNTAARELAQDIARREQTAAAAERVRIYLETLERRVAPPNREFISTLQGGLSLHASDLHTLLAALNTEQENNR